MKVTEAVKEDYSFLASTTEVKMFHRILKPLYIFETAVIQLGDEGMCIMAEMEKSLHVKVFFGKTSHDFLQFHFSESQNDPIPLTINLKLIIDVLTTFVEWMDIVLTLAYKSEGSPFVLSIEHEVDSFETECLVKTRESEELVKLDIPEEQVINKVVLIGQALYGLLNELIKTAPHSERFEVVVSKSPSFLCFSAVGAVDIQVGCRIEESSELILNFESSESCKFHYNVGHLKQLMKMLELSKAVTLATNMQGILNITIETESDHLIKINMTPLQQESDDES